MTLIMSKETRPSGIGRNDRCFVCGKDNPQGLHLSIRNPEPGRAETEMVIPEHFSGWARLTHGGLLATLLDETMAYACISRAGNAVTMEITVRFLKPVEVGQKVRVTGWVQAIKGRLVETEGEILDPQGQEAARAKARFLKM
jgi:uncharacterized protein (TIGR00369 family)